MINRTEKALKEFGDLKNPWIEDLKDGHVSKKDYDFIASSGFDEILRKIYWNNQEEKKFSFQYPLPINGNYYKAKYLLLYSNPATETNQINTETINELVKCARLDKDAKLVIDDWEDWYISELDKFFILEKNKKLNLDEFFDQFCFINLFAYQTQTNDFYFKSKELEQLHQLPSTIFVKNLVNIGKSSGKEIIVIRRSEGVWKHSTKDDYMFEKLHAYYKKSRKRDENE